MTIDEGYIKYASDWTRGPAPDPGATDLLSRWRRPLYAAGLVGHYDDLGVGYGNISVRGAQDGQFIISGTQTGQVAETSGAHYSLVTSYDIAANCVACTGPVEASSESLTHAALYQLDPNIGAVVHIHSRELWKELLNRAPTTAETVAYGTPEMAREFVRLFRGTEFRTRGVAVMGGHEEGIVCIGASLEQAANRALRLQRDIE